MYYVLVKDGIPIGLYTSYINAMRECNDASYMIYEMNVNKNYERTIDIAGNIVMHHFDKKGIF